MRPRRRRFRCWSHHIAACEGVGSTQWHLRSHILYVLCPCQESVWQREVCGTFLPERVDDSHTMASILDYLKKHFQFSLPWGGQKTNWEFTPNYWGCQNLVETSPMWTCFERANSPWTGSLQGLELARFNQYCLNKLCSRIFPKLCPFFETSFW